PVARACPWLERPPAARAARGPSEPVARAARGAQRTGAGDGAQRTGAGDNGGTERAAFAG
ncbi:MAG: hypothetical protein OXH78_01555, partial [Acidimicrobiaceae bacterium]|nr:hypothetical protein [Acidimicrobiaceae bacterium]